MSIEVNEREKELIVTALYIMEGQCAGDELHYELEDELGGIPNPDEIRTLLDRIRA